MADRQAAVRTAFRRGYVAVNHEARPTGLEGWTTARFGALTFHLHPETSWAVARRGPAAVAVIGQAIDIEHGVTGSRQIARGLVERIAGGSLSAALRDAAYLGGRATYVLQDANETLIVPDLSGSHPIYWHHRGGRTTFSNYASLVAEATSAELNEAYVSLMRRARELGATRTIYWPGIETAYRGVMPVLPNHALHIPPAAAPTHERFYPFADTELEGDPQRAYARFKEVFTEHVRLVCSLDRRIGISLTGGVDSRTTLAAAAPHLRRRSATTWTYLNSAKPHPGMVKDNEDAAVVASNAGLVHTVVDLADADRTLPRVAAFGAAVERSLRYTSQMRSVPYAYAAQLPGTTLELQSMIAEYGTGFYKNRRGEPEAARLAELYQSSEFGKRAEIRDAFERFIDYADFHGPRLGPVDWHDLFYAEHRLARWASLRVQEVELVHRVQQPFNARASVEALVGLPLADRAAKQAQTRLIDELGSRPTPAASRWAGRWSARRPVGERGHGS